MAVQQDNVLEGITAEYVQSRVRAMQERVAGRNTRMDDYERLYKLDNWDGPGAPDERRISSATAFQTVEDSRAVLLTRAPVLEVPTSEVRDIETKRAENMEKYLIAVWYMLKIPNVIRDAEWYACCFGEAVIRAVHVPDDSAVDGELPLHISALDPRSVYASEGTRPGEDLEVAHVLERTRREILDEWGEVPGVGPADPEAFQEWLDDEVEYIDYWTSRLQWTEVEPEPGLRDDPLDVLTVEGVDELWDEVAQANPEVAEMLGLEVQTVEAEPEPRRVRKRVVINCALADEEWVAEPAIVAGYERLPFVRYQGIPTPLPGKDAGLSVLFPITGGDRKNGAIGLIAAESASFGLRHRLIEQAAAPALLTSDEDLAASGVDFSTGAVNPIGLNEKLEYLRPPGPHPAVDQHVAALQSAIEDATLPAIMRGRYVGDLSGVALSQMTNPVLMKIGSRQEIRERAYADLNGIVLALTEEYAPDEGWEVWGLDTEAQPFETQLRPDEISGYRRNLVHLSASLPRDEGGEIMTMAKLVEQRLMSRETFLDRLQQIKRTTTQSPWDEQKRIFRDLMLFNPELIEKIAPLLLSDYGGEIGDVMAQFLVEKAQAEQSQQAGPPMGPQQGPPQQQGPLPRGPFPPQGMGAPGMGPPGPMSPQQAMAMMQSRQGGGPPGPPAPAGPPGPPGPPRPGG